jgi:Lysophospholipase
MGSYLLRRYLSYKAEGLKGAIIVGTGQENDVTTTAGLSMISAMAKAKGWHHRSTKIRDMTYTAPYKIYDLNGIDKSNSWICSDPDIMEAYYNDPRCTFTFTLNGYDALLTTVRYVNQKRHINKIPKNLPLLLVSGELDPVGNLGKGVKNVYNKYVEAGITDIECHLFPGARHEILNEPNKAEVYEFINEWLNRH